MRNAETLGAVTHTHTHFMFTKQEKQGQNSRKIEFINNVKNINIDKKDRLLPLGLIIYPFCVVF